MTYGSSTGQPPIQVRMRRLAENSQNKIWLGMENAIPRDFGLAVNGKVIKMRMAENIAITPPSLLGIDRRIA